MPEPRRAKRLLVALAAVAALCTVVLTLRYTQRLPSGPVAIVWDREACAECRMHIGEPRFAAQLHISDGRVLNFDDPGCLLRYEAEQRPARRASYFHALGEDRWLGAEEVAFVPAEGSPMGYDLGAVPRGTRGALDYAAAQERVLARSQGDAP